MRAGACMWVVDGHQEPATDTSEHPSNDRQDDGGDVIFSDIIAKRLQQIQTQIQYNAGQDNRLQQAYDSRFTDDRRQLGDITRLGVE